MKKLYILAGIFALVNTLILKAQVTIGASEAPIGGALLQLKQITEATDNGINAYKGFGLPRVSLSETDQLYPMYLSNPADPASGPNADYTANKFTLDLTHTGLIVYNITGDDTFSPGVYMWTGSKWVSISEATLPLTAGTINCNSNVNMVRGFYVQGTPMNGGDYLLVPVKVTKPGVYTITGNTNNEYFFTTSGYFPQTGNYTINIPARGTPKNANLSPGDLVSLTMNGVDAGCTNIIIPVTPSTPDYSITNVTPYPAYYPVMAPLDHANYYLMVTLTVKVPGPWQLVSGKPNGYQFSAEGDLSSASGFNPNGAFPQTVTVTVPVVGGQANSYGTGIDQFTINNLGSATPSTYMFNVPLAAVGFSIYCENMQVTGNPFVQNEALTNQAITLPITVTQTGTTTINASGAGMMFTSIKPDGSLGEITFADFGDTTITLKPQTTNGPITGGNMNLSILSSAGGIASPCNVPVSVRSAVASIEKMTFVSYDPNANYIINTKTGINATPMVTLSVVSSTAGTYNITTTEINGVTYSGSGSLIASAATQQIVLMPTGTPVGVVGTQTFTASTTTGSAQPVTFAINFVHPAVTALMVNSLANYNLSNVKSYFNTSASGNTSSVADANYGVNGRIPTAGITLTNTTSNSAGAIATAVAKGGFDILLSGYNNNTWNADDVSAIVNFVKKGGVAFMVTENYNNGLNANANLSIRGVFQQLFTDVPSIALGNSTPFWLSTGASPGVGIFQAVNTDDPILNGPFGDLREKYLGDDATITNKVFAGTPPSDMVVLATPVPGTTDLTQGLSQATSYFAVRHKTLGFVWAGDAGFWGAFANRTSTQTGTSSPVNSVNPTIPQGYASASAYVPGLTGAIPVYNGPFMMNFFAWAIEYITQAPATQPAP